MEAGQLSGAWLGPVALAVVTSLLTIAGARWADKRKERATPFDLLLKQNTHLINVTNRQGFALRVLVPPLIVHIESGCEGPPPDLTDLKKYLREGETPWPGE